MAAHPIVTVKRRRVIDWYSIQRPHRGRHNRGRPPLQVIREFRPGRN